MLGGGSLQFVRQVGDEQAERVEAELRAARAAVASLRSELERQFASEQERLNRELEQASAAEAGRRQQERERVSRTEAALARLEAIGTSSDRELAARRHALDVYLSEAGQYERHVRDAVEAVAKVLPPSAETLTRDLLLPTVQLNGDDAVGSGTIVFSGANPETGKLETYVLTAHHVVRNILADTPRAKEVGIDVTIYLPGEKVVVKGQMVASSPKIDAALVRLATERRLPFVANVMGPARGGDIRVWDSVYAVGCPLGNDPVPSQGAISSLHNELNGANYWMINAPTYFGNSGGGIYSATTRELIGVFSKIYTHGKGTPVVVPHMGLATPMPLIREWLESEKLDFVLASRVEEVGLAAK